MFGCRADGSDEGRERRRLHVLGDSFSSVVVRWALDGATADAILGTEPGGSGRIVLGSLRPTDEQCRRLGLIIDIDILGRRLRRLSDPRAWVRSHCGPLGRAPLDEMLTGTAGLMSVRSHLLEELRRRERRG